MICYESTVEDKLNTFYSTLIISAFYFVTSSGRRNWQHIEVYLGEVIPKYVFLEQNSSVTLYCNCKASAVRWTFRNAYLARHVGAGPVPNRHFRGSKQLTLINLKLEDFGRYFCGWTSGGRNFESAALVWMLTNNVGELYKYNFGKVSPSWVEVTKNSTVTLTCHSVMPTEWFSVHFLHQSKLIQDNSITLLNLQEEQSGEYICRGSNPYNISNRHFVFHAKSRIIVDGVIIRRHSSRP